jgi:hypothetical protein
MHKPRWLLVLGVLPVSVFSGILIGPGILNAQTADLTSPDVSEPAKVAEPDCPFFGPQRERYLNDALRRSGAIRSGGMRNGSQLSSMTAAVSKLLGYVPGGSRTYTFDQAHQAGTIDSYIGADFQAHGIKAAPKTTDWEFIRRVSLDLTGRIPAPDRVLVFVADTAPDKRAKLIEELLAKPEWVDKWTMYFGDLYKNTVNKPSTSLNRFPRGRNAFYDRIRSSPRKAYTQMATELTSGIHQQLSGRRGQFPVGQHCHRRSHAGHHGPDGTTLRTPESTT